MRAPLLVLLLTLPWPLEMVKPDWVDEALYNPRRRTEEAVEAYRAGDAEAAAARAEKALAVAPQREGEDGALHADPRLAFNAGTARLAAGREGRAVELLEQAATHAPTSLAPAAHYNLGNARLAAGDTAGAVEAFKAALRHDPTDADAKHNLEVALRRLEEERKMPLRPPQESPGGERPGEEEQGEGGGSDEPADEVRDDTDAADPGDGEEEGRSAPTPPPGEGGQERGEPGESPLPRFEDQPDMTAEQAAALLEAVENLERRQRQQEAAERARRSDRGEKDW